MEGLALSSGGTLYGTDDGGNLYSINTTTGAATLIGSTGLGDVEGLGFDGSTLLGTNFNSPTTIYSINTTTAAATSVVSASTGVVRGMALDGNEAFVASGSAVQSLETINLTSGAVADIGTLAPFFAALAYDGTLYGLDSSGNEYTINQSNADLTLVGNTGGQFFLDATLAPVSAVPEPTSILLLVTVLAGAGFALHRKQQA
jgi:hypothetical protein